VCNAPAIACTGFARAPGLRAAPPPLCSSNRRARAASPLCCSPSQAAAVSSSRSSSSSSKHVAGHPHRRQVPAGKEARRRVVWGNLSGDQPADRGGGRHQAGTLGRGCWLWARCAVFGECNACVYARQRMEQKQRMQATALELTPPRTSTRPLAHPQESIKARHPQLLYESKLYKILQGGGESGGGRGGGGGGGFRCSVKAALQPVAQPQRTERREGVVSSWPILRAHHPHLPHPPSLQTHQPASPTSGGMV